MDWVDDGAHVCSETEGTIMQATSNTLFSSTAEKARVVRTPQEFEIAQERARKALFAEMTAVKPERIYESSRQTAKLSPMVAFAVFIASLSVRDWSVDSAFSCQNPEIFQGEISIQESTTIPVFYLF